MSAATDWCRFDAARRTATLTLHVQPNASASVIAGLHGGALKIRVAAPAVDDKANKALIDWLKRTLLLRANQVSILSGVHGRRKRIQVTDVDADFEQRLKRLVIGK
jgi:uncharacterized protein